jgi:hypothetical protein
MRANSINGTKQHDMPHADSVMRAGAFNKSWLMGLGSWSGVQACPCRMLCKCISPPPRSIHAQRTCTTPSG